MNFQQQQHTSGSRIIQSHGVSLSKQPCHKQHQLPSSIDEETDATTAYSSWYTNDNDALSTCLTSCPSETRDDHDDIQSVGSSSSQLSTASLSSDEVSPLDDPQVIANMATLSESESSYSFHSATDEDDTSNDDERRHQQLLQKQHCAQHTVRNGALQEISERAVHLLNKQGQYQVGNFFCYAKSTDGEDDSSAAIDSTCRARMMEWSFRVVEFSFPPPSSTCTANSTMACQSSTQRRNHSIQALQIISTAFSYVDRVMSLQASSSNCTMKIQCRKDYKLLCMTSLHLAAKISGFFRFYMEEDEMIRLEAEESEQGDSTATQDAQEERVCEDSTQDCTQEDDYYFHLGPHESSSLSMSSSWDEESEYPSVTCTSSSTSPDITVHANAASSRSLNSSSFHSTFDEEDGVGQTILSTPSGHLHPQHCHEQSHYDVNERRPPFDILSLVGLSSLSQGEFTIEEMTDAELLLLTDLEWKLGSGNTFEWLDLLLDLTTAVGSAGAEYGESKDRLHRNQVHESATLNLERVIESNTLMNVPSSTIALAAFIHAVEHQKHRHFAHDAMMGEDCIMALVEEVTGSYCDEQEFSQLRYVIEKQNSA